MGNYCNESRIDVEGRVQENANRKETSAFFDFISFLLIVIKEFSTCFVIENLELYKIFSTMHRLKRQC